MKLRDVSVARRPRHQLDRGCCEESRILTIRFAWEPFKREAKLAMFAHGLLRGETVTQRRCFTGFETRLR
jgi:hypothetical protein